MTACKKCKNKRIRTSGPRGRNFLVCRIDPKPTHIFNYYYGREITTKEYRLCCEKNNGSCKDFELKRRYKIINKLKRFYNDVVNALSRKWFHK